MQTEQRPFVFYILMLLLCALVTFLGFQFGRIPGAIVGFFFTCVVNFYALQIKFD